MKDIMPCLREKNRYIVYKIKSSIKLNQKSTKNGLYSEMLRFLGEFDLAKASLKIMEDWDNQIGIIKTNNKYKDKVISSIILIDQIGNKNVNVGTIKVSGTLKKARNYIKEHKGG